MHFLFLNLSPYDDKITVLDGAGLIFLCEQRKCMLPVF